MSINALVLVNTTVAQLEAWTQTLQMELDNITMQTMMLNTTCTNLNKSACYSLQHDSHYFIFSCNELQCCKCFGCVNVCMYIYVCI